MILETGCYSQREGTPELGADLSKKSICTCQIRRVFKKHSGNAQTEVMILGLRRNLSLM